MELTIQTDIELVRRELRETYANYARALAERDAAALAKHYASDAVLLPPGGKPIGGADRVRTYCVGLCALPYTFEIAGFTLEEVLLAPPYAIEFSRFSGKAHDLQRGGTQIYFAKALVVWRYDGDRWLIVRDMYNDLREMVPSAF